MKRLLAPRIAGLLLCSLLVSPAVAQQTITTHGSSYHRTGYRDKPENARRDLLIEVVAPRTALPTNYDLALPRIVRPEVVAPRFARPSHDKPELIRPRVDIIGANVETRHVWRVVEKPQMVKPVYDTNLRVHRDIDYRVDRLQESGECEYCKTGLKSHHRFHTHPSVLAATDPAPPRTKEEELREQVPPRELYQREVTITNRFYYWYPLSVQQAERGPLSIRELQPIR